ncbi:MAG: DoxX family protein [Ginsengibacter sp.]
MTYTNLSAIAQLIVALSVFIVWIFRFENILKEFKQFGLSDLTRNMVGATKISLSTLLVVGIWFPSLILIPASLMAFLMICAQIAHFKIKNPLIKHLPSFLLLLLCIFIIIVKMNSL